MVIFGWFTTNEFKLLYNITTYKTEAHTINGDNK